MPTFPQFPAPGSYSIPKADQRAVPRFAIGPAFPLKAILSLADRRTTRPGLSKPGLRPKPAAGKHWPATLIDLSTHGARLHLSLAVVAFPDDLGWLTLSLGTDQLVIPCIVAHFRSQSRYALCGLQLLFSDPAAEKAYLQLLEPVMLGASLATAEAPPDPSGRFVERYTGKDSTTLTVWRQNAEGPVTSFDFRLNRTGVRWRAGASELTTYGVEERRAALKLKLKSPDPQAETTPTFQLDETRDETVRWLFCLTVASLPDAVSADVRKFLQSLVIA